MDYAALKTELNGEAYAGMAAAQKLAAINAKTITVPNPGTYVTELGVIDTLGVADGEAFLVAIETAAQASSTVARAVRWLKSTTGIDVGNPIVQAQLSALVTANVVTAEAANALIARGSKQISRAEQLGFGEVGIGYLNNAERI
jgi:hypothetical protein